jgi:predicted  nucleic acid-binding Zn-ribbon protein
MKNLLQNLLVFLAFGLCALCAWQWYIQTLLHTQGEALQKIIFNQSYEIQGYTNSIKNMNAEIAGLSTRVNELKQTAATNEQAALEQKREITHLRLSSEVLSNEISQYKDVVDKLEAKLKEASEGIEKQNNAFKKLIADRDEAIQKYNDSMKERNALAEKYNDLVDRFNKLQAANAAKP